MGDMTDQDALAIARRRWGKLAQIWHPEFAFPGQAWWCAVGVGRNNIERIEYGFGRDWAEALKHATKRGH